MSCTETLGTTIQLDKTIAAPQRLTLSSHHIKYFKMSDFLKNSNDTKEPVVGSANNKPPSPKLLSSPVHESPEYASGYREPPPYVHKNSASINTEAQESGSGGTLDTFYAAPQIRVTVAPPVAMTESGSLILAPPLAFSRPAPDNLSYPPFEPTFLISRAKYLDKGFPLAPPPSSSHPHPFTTHDVAEADWVGFLKSIKTAATLTDKDMANSRLPIISMIPFVSKFAASGVQAYMKSSKFTEVAKEVDLWNRHFFHPRRINVILLKGQEQLNGKEKEASLLDLGDIVQTGDQGNSAVDEEAKKQESIIGTKDSVYRLFIRSL